MAMAEGGRRLQRVSGIRGDRVRPRPPAGASPMTVTIAGITFDSHEYDDRGDVLYVSVGPPREAARTLGRPRGPVGATPTHEQRCDQPANGRSKLHLLSLRPRIRQRSGQASKPASPWRASSQSRQPRRSRRPTTPAISLVQAAVAAALTG